VKKNCRTALHMPALLWFLSWTICTRRWLSDKE